MTYARATLTIEVRNIGSWGPGCQLDQVYRQAAEAAIGKIRNTFKPTDVFIIGDVKVTAIITDET
jgi:hypothetical protein